MDKSLGLKFIQKPYKIIHIDMDYFYAQVEIRDNPKLRNKPVAIGGPSKTKGVLCTSNYIARKYGVRAAMPTFKAFKNCPELILVAPNFQKYKDISNEIHEIFCQYTDLIQPLSLDEAFLDVSDSPMCQRSATLIAQEIRRKIFKQTGLTASAGVSFNKLIAKIASDYNKPNGLTVVSPHQREDFMASLELGSIPGIGKTSLSRFKKLGISRCSEITNLGIIKVIELFGKKNGIDLYEKCLGISNSPVINLTKRKAMSVENTFFEPLSNLDDMKVTTNNLINEFQKRLLKANEFHFENRSISHIKIKIRDSDFNTLTKEIKIDSHISDDIILKRILNECGKSIISENVINLYKNMKLKRVRLIGVGVKFCDYLERQIELTI